MNAASSTFAQLFAFKSFPFFCFFYLFSQLIKKGRIIHGFVKRKLTNIFILVFPLFLQIFFYSILMFFVFLYIFSYCFCFSFRSYYTFFCCLHVYYKHLLKNLQHKLLFLHFIFIAFISHHTATLDDPHTTFCFCCYFFNARGIYTYVSMFCFQINFIYI